MRDSRVERIRVIAVAFAATLSSTLVHGGGSTDGSVGAVQNLSGNFAIPESLGAVRGSNLFHSFSRFNVDFGESATFTTTSSNLQNVISRVTGGQVSTIHGILKLQAAPGSAPAFYFVNPAGVVFGAGAVIDVPSSFHVSTAQSIKFGDGFIWNTGSANQSSLTIAPPEAFGFLGSRSAAPVAIDTSKSDPAELTQRLELTPNSTLSIAAGDIQVGSRIIAIPGGKLRLSSTGADTVDVPVSHSQANPPPLSGPLTVSGASICADAACSIAMQSGGMRFQGSSIGVLDKDGVPGGSISFRGADITLDNSRVFSATTSNSNANPILIEAAGQLHLTNGGRVVTSTSGVGATSQIDIKAGSMMVRRGNASSTGVSALATTSSSGNFGQINIDVAGELSILASGQISADGGLTGSSGSLNVNAGAIRIDGQNTGSIDTGIFLDDVPGTLAIKTKALSLFNQGQISSSTFSTRPAGDVLVESGTLEIDQAAGQEATGIFSIAAPTATADGGRIKVDVADTLTIRGGEISTNTISKVGRGGDIDVRANSIDIDGRGLRGTTRGIASEAKVGSSGQPGNISVHANRVQIFNGGGVSIKNLATVVSPANIGQSALTVSASEIVLGGGQITAETSGNVTASKISLTSAAEDGSLRIASENNSTIGQVTSSTLASGAGGDIEISALNLTLSGVDVVSDAKPGSTGAAGRVSIEVRGDMSVVNNTRVATDTFGTGDAGSVQVRAGTLLIDPSEISSNSRGTNSGNAGSVVLNVDRNLSLIAGGRVSSSTQSRVGGAGSISIFAKSVDVDGATSGVFAAAATGSSGQPGNVAVTAVDSISLANGGTLNIGNGATVVNPASIQTTSLAVTASSISLSSGAQITSASLGNIAASDISLVFSDLLRMRNAAISTTAQEGDGGAVSIQGGRGILLDRSQITTSVLGANNGNGGNIAIRASALASNSGFIQANTEALASGGSITVDSLVFVPSGSQVSIGGNTPFIFQPDAFGFNVIQAAAPQGNPGNVGVANIELDTAAKVRAIEEPALDLGPLGDGCHESSTSSLDVHRERGLAARASDLMTEASPSRSSNVAKECGER